MIIAAVRIVTAKACDLSPFSILILKDRGAALEILPVLFGNQLALKVPHRDGYPGMDVGFTLDFGPPTAFVPLQKPTVLALDILDDLSGNGLFSELRGVRVSLHLRFYDVLEHRIARMAGQ